MENDKPEALRREWWFKERYPKDPKFEGIYVKRCKCGARPYHDRIYGFSCSQWVSCGYCGRTGKSGTFKEAVENWNTDNVHHR